MKQVTNRFGDSSIPTQWKPGESGNLAGRPPNSITSELRKLAEAIDDNGIEGRKKLARKLWDLAMAADLPALKEIIDRLDGKVGFDPGEGAAIILQFIPAKQITEGGDGIQG